MKFPPEKHEVWTRLKPGTKYTWQLVLVWPGIRFDYTDGRLVLQHLTPQPFHAKFEDHTPASFARWKRTAVRVDVRCARRRTAIKKRRDPPYVITKAEVAKSLRLDARYP